MARTLASAWVSISPSGFSTFASKTSAGLKTALRGVNAQVPITANTAGAKISIDDLKVKLDELSKGVTDIKFRPKDKEAIAAITGLNVKLDALSRKIADPNITVQGKTRALADIAAVDLAIERLNKKTARPTISRILPSSGGGGLLGSGIGAGSSVIGGGSSAAPAAGPALGGLGAPGVIAAIVAGLGSLPFIAQAAAGGITFALGGALAGMAILGAAKTAAVKKSFADLKTSASDDLTKIGASFVPVLTGILGDAKTVLGQLTPVFAGASKTIAGPFKAFSDALIQTFAQPAVKKSIQDVANAFAKLLTAISPSLAGDVQNIASGISKIATAVGKNPDAFRNFISFLSAAAGGVLTALASLTTFASYIEAHFLPAVHEIAVIFDGVRHEVADDWDAMFQVMIGSQIRFGHNVEHAWDTLMNDLAKAFDIFKNEVAIAWDKIELTFLNGVKFILDTMGKLPGPLGAPFRKAAIDIGNSMAGISADVKRRTAQMQADFDALHGKTVQIHMNGQGQYTITGSIIAASQGKGGSGNAAGGLAAGGLIRMGSGPRADDVHAMLSRGEVVVPTHMVQQGAVDHLRGRLPGFASGGQVSGSTSNLNGAFVSGMYSTFQNRMNASMISAMKTSLKTAEAAAKAAAAAVARAAAAGGGGNPGPGGPGTLSAGAIEGYWTGAGGPGGQVANIAQAITVPESGRRPSAVQQGQPYSTTGWGLWQITPGNSEPQAGINSALLNPHNNAIAAVAKYRGAGSSFAPWTTYEDGLYRPYLLAAGGMVPGYASGGVTPAARQGQTYLNAWRSRHGGGFGAAWGPVVVNQQIAAMQAAAGRATTLSHASGLSTGQRRFWSSAAADEKKKLAVLNKELTTERTRRAQLVGTDAVLAGDIKAAGKNKSLAKNVTSWKKQMSAHQYTISQISKMLGYSDAFIAAHPPAPVLPAITHTYGGDVSDALGAFISSVAPFGLGGMVKSYDRGGWLPQGLSMAYNGTGRPESVGGNGNVTVSFELTGSGNSAFDQLMIQWMRKTVKVKGGTGPGATDRAFGQH